jgi:hypothetical protein
MRLILLTFMVCADSLAADPRRTIESITMSDLRSQPKAAKSKRTFRPLRLLRRLGNAESEFGLRLSSWGIQRKVETGNSEILPRPTPLTETSASMPQRSLGGPSQ